HSLVASTRN
ncbi:exonuclease family domain protein, partial [Escherichia coli EC1850]